jgi:hypothetical protein
LLPYTPLPYLWTESLYIIGILVVDSSLALLRGVFGFVLLRGVGGLALLRGVGSFALLRGVGGLALLRGVSGFTVTAIK